MLRLMFKLGRRGVLSVHQVYETDFHVKQVRVAHSTKRIESCYEISDNLG